MATDQPAQQDKGPDSSVKASSCSIKDDDTGTDVKHVEQVSEATAFADSIEDTKPSKRVWMIILTVAMGGFLFGYDTGYISAVLVNVKNDLGHDLSSSEQELVTSITSAGALIGAVIAGLPADKFGRKFGIYIGCVLFVIGSVLQSAAYSVTQFTIGRFVVGLGVGSATMIVPLYIGEISIAKYRGRTVALNNVSVTFGQLVAAVLGAGFTYVQHGWRYHVAIGGLPPFLLCFLLLSCPESPRLLLMHKKFDEAKKALSQLYPNATQAQIQAKAEHIAFLIESESRIVGSRSLRKQFKLLHTVPGNFRALFIACSVMAISQLCGFNSVLYYSATLFSLVGFSNPTAVAITVAGTNFIFNIVNMTFIDKAGRRLLLLINVLLMAITMVVVAVAFHWIPVNKDLELLSSTSNWASIVVLVAIIIYVAAFSSGVATIAWIGTEFLPIEVRALGTMLNTVTCWGTNLISSSTFLSLLKGATPSGAFGYYAGIGFTGWLLILFCFPEVKGMPLEEIRHVFEDGFGVRKAAALQKAAASQRRDKTVTV
ncbi:general substrate transporter [Nemania sp. FL0031]|nr:general substrate transporter [Nemania sp. FL0031]